MDSEVVTTRVFDAPRERVFKAWSHPEHLKHWWGPNGFTNTFEEFDFRPGGHWRFVMHGPDGANYPNHSVFSEIVRPERIVFQHISDHRFEVTATFVQAGSKTELTFRMRFESAEELEKIREVVTRSNEENFDRLAVELGKVS